MHFTPLALAFAFERAGKSIPAKMAMMAMTTRSSIRVNPAAPWARCLVRGFKVFGCMGCVGRIFRGLGFL
jgi:hypothetical protein